MIRSFVSKISKKAFHWANRVSYNIHHNGEMYLLAKTQLLKFKILFDVGANVGEWTKLALHHHPNAEIHSFELTESTHQKLVDNVKSTRATLNNLGLADREGEVTYKDYGPAYCGVNTIMEKSTFWDDVSPPKELKGYLNTGKNYCNERAIQNIDFLKIDVEGAEHLVLQGFSQMLADNKIRLIQFEYGYTHGDSKFLMRDFYEFFEGHQYIVGRLTGIGVEFLPWNYYLNSFESGPNYVAIHKDDQELKNLILSPESP